MIKLFTKYASVGVLNTLLHWIVFSICIYVLSTSQALANFIGFIVAVSFSFFVNAKFTFSTHASASRYFLYVTIMGALSALVGWSSDRLHIQPIVTLIAFSGISLVCGFIFSKFIVFRNAK
ncbi:GtrA family protein [Enterobacter ludwigii]